ncbi:MAG: glycosyltransferase family 2 protein [Bacteroidales bacterium]|nr:glycosyltransferase family 2 protein [Bacteroidales bacterium]
MNQTPEISIVVSVYNEQNVIQTFYEKLSETIKNIPYEILFINDGSTDESAALLNQIASKDVKTKVIHLSRNFGHEAAMLAGIDHAKGKAIICMDADLQHPPSVIPSMLQKFYEGYNIVLMKRKQRADASFFSTLASKLFYKLINYLSPVKFEQNASDFFLIDHKVQQCLIHNFRERTRFLRGFIQLIGFQKASIEFEAPARFAGQSKYNTRKLLKLSINAIAAFSDKPLNLGIIIGLIMGLGSVVVGIYSIVMYFVDKPVSGYTTIVVLMSLMFSINLVIMGIIGKYIAYIFQEIKQRPIYIIDRIVENK